MMRGKNRWGAGAGELMDFRFEVGVEAVTMRYVAAFFSKF